MKKDCSTEYASLAVFGSLLLRGVDNLTGNSIKSTLALLRNAAHTLLTAKLK